MTTKIFKDFEEFDARTDNSVNGVSPEFAFDNPSWEEDNESNTGCWDCIACWDCSYCIRCTECVASEHCVRCVECVDCENCSYCNDCVRCDLCVRCLQCLNCTDCVRGVADTGETSMVTPHSSSLLAF